LVFPAIAAQTAILQGEKSVDGTRAKADAHLFGLGLSSTASVFVNGRSYTPSDTSARGLKSLLLVAQNSILPTLQRAVYYRQVSDGSNVHDAIMKLVKPAKRRVPAAFSAPRSYVHVIPRPGQASRWQFNIGTHSSPGAPAQAMPLGPKRRRC
jgi:hypothetical protein